ncbi:hypothetical protein [Terribacillus saccharophilus]|uniref:hypothetical protein n=1 Tax=Terribacillus saccharophilus TaxID=361277 RepID=UPI00068D93ED|nr:hypothetical protein [Terribacillus goriensis]
MKKTIISCFAFFTIFLLTACGASTQDNLQSQKWNVVATNGEAYTASFGQDTITFTFAGISMGFSYSIDGDVLTMERQDSDEGPISFNIEKNSDEYTFTAQTEDVKDQYGDLTLSEAK